MRLTHCFTVIATMAGLGCLASLPACTAPLDNDEEVGASEAALASPIHHVVLVSGGFGSCEPDGVRGFLPTEMTSLLSEIRTRSGSEPTVVRTCFGGVGSPDRFDRLVTRGHVTIRGGSTTLSNLETELHGLLSASKPSRFDAYGHSHGGWLVGRVVQDLGTGTADSFTLNVVISDAISRPLCTPAVVVSGNGRADYCNRFPPDLSQSAIRANVKGYLGTAFQVDDWLHSTPLAGADNVPFNPGHPIRIGALNHRALRTVPLAWGGFRSRLQFR